MSSFSGEWSGSSHPWPGGCPALSGGLRGCRQREQGPARPPSLLSTSLNLSTSLSQPLTRCCSSSTSPPFSLPGVSSSSSSSSCPPSSPRSTRASPPWPAPPFPSTRYTAQRLTQLVSIKMNWSQYIRLGLKSSELVSIHKNWFDP